MRLSIFLRPHPKVVMFKMDSVSAIIVITVATWMKGTLSSLSDGGNSGIVFEVFPCQSIQAHIAIDPRGKSTLFFSRGEVHRMQRLIDVVPYGTSNSKFSTATSKVWTRRYSLSTINGIPPTTKIDCFVAVRNLSVGNC